MADLDSSNSSDEDRVEHTMSDLQMEKIVEFQTVTGLEDVDESRRILESMNWNLEAAISAHLGLEHSTEEFNTNDNHINQSHSSTPGVSTIVHPRNSSTASTSTQSISSNPDVDNLTEMIARSRPFPMPPPVVRRGRGAEDSRNNGIFSWLFKMVTTPFDIFFRYLWDFIGFGLRFIRPAAITDPVQDVMDYIRSYESRFGPEHPVFYQGTYSQALNDAKRELKFLLVYLHSDEHDLTEEFCRNVMPNQDFRNIIRENMLFWSCSVSKSEGYRTSQALRENTYPFLALIVLKNNRMTIVSRIEGITDPVLLLNRLHQSVADNEAYIVAERQERLERSMTQTLRMQQDAAYQESLKADQEKERLKQQEKDRKQQEENERQRIENEEKNRKEMLKQLKARTLENLKTEPALSDPNLVRVVIKLPCGTRLERRFLNSDSLKHLYDFVFSHPKAPDIFEVATNFPKRILQCKPNDEVPNPPTFLEAGLGKTEMLFVYDLES